MSGRGIENTAYQRGRPRKDGTPVKRQLRPNEESVLRGLRDLIATHTSAFSQETEEGKKADIKAKLGFCKLQLRVAQTRYGQPVDEV